MNFPCLQIEWGWITPGTNETHRLNQSRAHLKVLRGTSTKALRHLLLVHCGWWLDNAMQGTVRDICVRNPEPRRSLQPAPRRYLDELSNLVRAGRIEFVVYPYAACVAEATSGEGLLRSLRLTRDLAEKLFRQRCRIYKNHDAVYGLDWGTVQMPQILRLLGGRYLVSGKSGVVYAPDGTEVETFGDTRSFYDLVKDPASLSRGAVFCMELHDHIALIKRMNKGSQFVRDGLRIQLQALSLEKYLSMQGENPRRYFSKEIGSKSWYGGVMDSFLVEQDVKSVELRLPMLQALSIQTDLHDRTKGSLEELWKRCFVLMDNHLLWQCHRYRPHFTNEAHQLVMDCKKMERSLLPPGKAVHALNPVPWKRCIVSEGKDGDILFRSVPGWGSGKKVAAEFPYIRKNGFSSPYRIGFGPVTYNLGKTGCVEEIKREGYKLSSDGLGTLVHICDRAQSRQIILRARNVLSHRGCLALQTEVDLHDRTGSEGVLNLGVIRGHAYLLRIEGVSAAGKIFSTTWHALHSLHWGGVGLPRGECRLDPLAIDIACAARLKLTIWVASESCVSIRDATLRLARNADIAIPLDTWEARFLTSIEYKSPSNVRACVIKESQIAKRILFQGDLGPGRFKLTVSSDIASPRLEYHLRLIYRVPTDLGVTTPPFDARDGSLFGAQCERPYLPGVAVIFPLPSPAVYHVDKPFYIQHALDDPVSTWHTDRREWWLGMSPFIGMNMAAASWRGDSMGVLTRGLKHFFRWRRANTEALALSLGATLIHVQTQGHSVAKNHSLFPVAGRTDHDPYEGTSFLRAHGTYDFHYAIHPGLGRTGERQRLKFWRSGQEFALPAHTWRTLNATKVKGISSSNSFVVVTALEEYGEKFCLRVANLSQRAQSTGIQMPFPVRRLHEVGKSRHAQSPDRKCVETLPAHAVRQIVFEKP